MLSPGTSAAVATSLFEWILDRENETRTSQQGAPGPVSEAATGARGAGDGASGLGVGGPWGLLLLGPTVSGDGGGGGDGGRRGLHVVVPTRDWRVPQRL